MMYFEIALISLSWAAPVVILEREEHHLISGALRGSVF